MIPTDGRYRRSEARNQAEPAQVAGLVGGARDLEAARALPPSALPVHVSHQCRPVQSTHSPLSLLRLVRGRGAQRADGRRHRHRARQAGAVRMMRAKRALRQIGIAVFITAMSMAASCGFGPSTFALSNASVDPTYECPNGASNSEYDVHATVHVDNGTSNTVSIQSVAAVMTLVATKGTWLEPLGDTYTASNVTFTPAS